MIGCVIACDGEAEILLSQTEIETIKTTYGKPVYTGKAFGKDVVIVVCGVGKVNAAAGACAAISAGADIILNFGAAGGLNDKTEVSEIYAVDKVVQYDFDCTQLNGGKIGTLDCPSSCPTAWISRAARWARATGSTTPPPTTRFSSTSAATSAKWNAAQLPKCASTQACPSLR